MLSLDLFDSKYERELREGAVDKLEQRLIDNLNAEMKDLIDRAKSTKDAGHKQALIRQYEKIKAKRDDIYKIKTEQQQPQRPPAKGLLKGKDLVTPQQRVAGATSAKPGMAGAVKDVAGGIKRWLKGEPDQGPTYEEVELPGQSPRAYGVGNFQRLVKANMASYPTVTLEFGANRNDDVKLDQKGLDIISDYYDGLENDSQKNHFIYRILPSRDETLKVLKSLGWTPQTQQELPGIPPQGELPLAEKKRSDKQKTDLEPGDVKVARELQKLRAQYPAAQSDLEAVAKAEIDSSERNQQQLSAIRGANQKQDALLKQLVALDQEQGQEIDNLDKENNSLEKQLARVQTTNDRLQQTISQMTGTKQPKTKTDKSKSQKQGIDIIPGVDVAPGVARQPDAATDKKPTTSPAIANMARQISGFSKPAPTIDKDQSDDSDTFAQPELQKPDSMKKLRTKSANVDDFRLVGEHGGGIGPRQHWQSLMNTDEEIINENIKDTASATAVIACLLVGGGLQGCASAPEKTTVQQAAKTGQDIGRVVYNAKNITKAGTEEEVRQELKNIMRGMSRPEELNNSNILRIWRKIQGQPPVPPEPEAQTNYPAPPRQRWPQYEAKEIKTKDDFLNARDHLLRKIGIETNPVNKQILRAEIRKLENQAEQEGWLAMQQRLIREDTAALAAEDAILKRIFVKHKGLMMEYGTDKITQAAESVAYNVGDIAHITDEQINEWIGQVEQILGARP